MISKFMNARSKRPVDVEIKDILKDIRNGEYREWIENLRKIDRENEEERYSDAKKLLPAVTFSGHFSGRNDDDLLQHSGVMCLDWDHLEEDALDHKKMKCEQDRYIVAYFDSPGGEGLKALIKTPVLKTKEEHLQYYDELMRMYPDADPKNANVARLCFLSYDPDLYYQPDKHTFTLESNPAMASMPKIPEMGAGNAESGPSPFDPPVKGNRDNHLLTAASIHFKNGMSREDVWAMIYNQNEASQDPLPQADIERIVDSANKYQGTRNEVKTVEDVNLYKEILKDSFFDFEVELPPIPILLGVWNFDSAQIVKQRMLTLGNLSAMIGLQKSKKTLFMSMAIAAVTKGSEVGEKLHGEAPMGKKKVLYFDCEQAQHDTKRVIDNVQSMGGDVSNLVVHSLMRYDPETRLAFILERIKYMPDDVAMVVIDGAADLVKSINNEEEAKRIAHELLSLAMDKNIHIMTAIHKVKSGGHQYARGHIGTEITNKCELVIETTEKEDNKSVSIVKCSNTRGKPFDDFEIGFTKNKPFIEGMQTIASHYPRLSYETY